MASVTFPIVLGGDGSTVSDDSNPTTGLANGGHRTRFVPALSNTVKIAGNMVDSVTAAINSPLALTGSSTTPLLIGSGVKSLTLQQTDKAFFVGGYVSLVNASLPSEFMFGQVTAFNSSTGAMTVNVTGWYGSTTVSSWIVSGVQQNFSLLQSGTGKPGVQFNGYRLAIGPNPNRAPTNAQGYGIDFEGDGVVGTNGYGEFSISKNTYVQSGLYRAKSTGAGLRYEQQSDGTHAWYRAQSVAQGTQQTFNLQMRLNRYNLLTDQVRNIGGAGDNAAPTYCSNNAILDGGAETWTRAAYGSAGAYKQDQGTHYWLTDGVTGSSGSAITWSQIMQTFGQYLLIGYTSSNGSYRLQVNSQIFATSSTIATSDANYKQDVVTLDGMLDVVNALRPVEFNWKKHPVHNFDTDTKTVGFLAQEVRQVLSDKPYVNAVVKVNQCEIEPAVYEEIDGERKEVKPAVTEEFLGIAEGNLIAILTRAVQELSAKVDAQAARIEALEAAA